MDDLPRRILIRASVQQIPGQPCARPWAIWDLFCETLYKRNARYTLEDSCPEAGIDAVHVLPGYDSSHDTKAWFMTDVRVKKENLSVDLESIPFEIYRAAYNANDDQWYVSLKH